MASFPSRFELEPEQRPSIPFRNFVPVDGRLAAPITLVNPDSQPDPSFVNVMGVGLGLGEGWGEPQRKRAREQEQMEGSSQVTSIDFLQTGGSVSTGLALSFDDRRIASSGESMVGMGMLDEEIERQLRRHETEMDRFIKMESERLRQQILQKTRATQIQTLASFEGKILSRIREKEAEVEDINQKNAALEEQIKQLSMEISAWQHRAKYNENIMTTLKYNLQQLYAENQDNNKEGCGDSEVDDTASCCNGGAMNFQLLYKENKDMKDLMTCRVCRVNEVCMLLLPCRHVCLCKDCESKLSFCPLCQSSKLFGTEIYM